MYFTDSFDSGDLSKTGDGFSWLPYNNTTVQDGSLLFNYGVNGNYTAEQRFTLGGYYQEVWCRFRLFIPVNYFHHTQPGATNNKWLINLWDGAYESPHLAMNPNVWAKQDGSGVSEGTMFVWSPVTGYDRHHWQEWPDNQVVRVQDRGKWVEVLCHFGYATAANNDGIAQIWTRTEGEDARQLLNITNGPWHVPGAPGFNNGYLFGSTNSDFTEQTIIRVKDFTISDTPLSLGSHTMAVKTAISLGFGYAQFKEQAAMCKSEITALRNLSASGALNGEKLLKFQVWLRRTINYMQQRIDMPGIQAFARNEENDPAYNFDADAAAMQAVLGSLLQWIYDNIPKDVNGYQLLVTQADANTDPAWRTFTAAQTASLRTQIDAALATLE